MLVNVSENADNAAILQAMTYYYSETPPMEEGNYRRYDTDGITPIAW